MKWINGLVWLGLIVLSVACSSPQGVALPTQAAAAGLPERGGEEGVLPATWTPAPILDTPTARPGQPTAIVTPSDTPLPIPTKTPFTPVPSRTSTPTITPDVTETRTLIVKPLGEYSASEIIPYQAFPRPAGDNGWGMHWIPTVQQDRGTVDRFIAEVVQMNIKWVVFLNDNTNIGFNDYLVDRLVANGIMPVMRVFRSDLTPFDGDLGGMVRHYRARGVIYYQLYNEPNVNIENTQSFANPNNYAVQWATSARIVIANGGLPGIGSLSPGGAYDHFAFLDSTLNALRFNGDSDLLNWAWFSAHNYHGLRAFDDPGGFLLFRSYDEIIRSHLGRSLPIIGTEGGSYSDDPQVEVQFIAFQYNYMADAEPYFFAFSYWILANLEGGSADPAWEWQTLFRSGWTHPAVAEFFYTGGG